MLLERDAELARVHDALRAAGTHDGSLLVVSGPLGVGKTALLHAIASIAADAGARVLRATASALERDFPLAVARQIYEPLVSDLSDGERARVADGVADFLHPLSTAAGFESPPVVDHALLHGMRHLLSVISHRQPVVLLIDDLQWADEESLRCTGYLVNRLCRLGVLVVVALSDGEADSERPLVRNVTSRATGVLRLGKLTLAGTRQLVRERFGEQGSEWFARACHAVSGGSPLLLRSILAELAATGHRQAVEVDAVHACRPAALRNRLLSRLRRQPAPVRAFVSALCFLDDVADLESIGKLAGLDPIGCKEVERVLDLQGLVVPGRPPRFVHPVVRDAVEELVSAAEGERLHIAAATLLHDAGHPAETVAAHLLAVPSKQGLWAVDVLRVAAEQAVLRGEHAAAARYLRRALLDTPTDCAERADLLVELATVERTDDPSASVRHVLEAVSLLRNGPDRAAAVVLLTPTTFGAAPLAVPEVVREVAAELGDADQLTGTSRELARRLEARLRYLDDRYRHDLVRSAHRLRALDHEVLLRTSAGRELLAVLLHTAALTGQVPSREIVVLGHRILGLESPDPVLLHTSLPIVVSALALADRASATTPWLDAALDEAGRQRDPVAEAVVRVEQALVLLGTGRVVEAELAAEASIDELGDRWFDAVKVPAMRLAAAALELPDTRLTERILGLCGDRAEHPVLRAVHQVLCARASEDLPLALERLLDCGRHLERAGWRNPSVLPWRTKAAKVQQRLGNTAEAFELAEAELEVAKSWGAPAAVGRALRVLGELASGDEAVRLTRDALDVLGTSENEFELARVHLRLAELVGASYPDDVELHLCRGRQLAVACGVPSLVDHVAPGPGRTASGASRGPVLTPAELRVAGLAAEGRTNQAIADEFGVSCRAVEKHLTNVYRKLDLSGRSELKAELLAAQPQDGLDVV